MPAAPAHEPRPGQLRPGGRTERTRRAVFDAAAVELAEVGYVHLSTASVARRAGVALSTVRRRWPSKAELVAAAIVGATAEQVETPDFGDLEQDLQAFAESVAEYHRDPTTNAMLRATLSLPPALLDEVRSTTWRDRARVASRIMKRALERGEIASQRDAARIIEMLIAPIWLRTLVTGVPIDQAAVDAFVADALAAARSAPER